MVWAKPLLSQTKSNNRGNQNTRQVPQGIFAGFEVFQFLIEAIGAIDSRSL